jgi:hypothetical protein
MLNLTASNQALIAGLVCDESRADFIREVVAKAKQRAEGEDVVEVALDLCVSPSSSVSATALSGPSAVLLPIDSLIVRAQFRRGRGKQPKLHDPTIGDGSCLLFSARTLQTRWRRLVSAVNLGANSL